LFTVPASPLIKPFTHPTPNFNPISSLVSNSSLPSNSGFHRASVDDIDDRFLCRGDVNATVCHGCVVAATTNITRLCPNDTESYIWYDECTLIYSNSTFNNDDIVPGITLNDEGSTVNSN
ncbi:cysteine-rich repeat secretory protein 9-like, partial [Vigna umbellata]|uniref:cysteine-rich repeat secretory protein 9-like n=1 Tax=Vigna umbellata TaxID=87088 RepID=UPI001F5EAF68